MNNDKIKVIGAKENNLKNISIELPKNKLIVMTGLSGSGKSSLAFDTLYKEGQRRYMESLNAFARQFLGNFEKPNVDAIEGLCPSISIDQKTTSNNPRSTVGTITEIYDYLRLVYARIGTPYDPVTNKPLTKQTIQEMTDKVLELEDNTSFYILSPIIERKKGTHKKLFEDLLKEGFTRVYINDEIHEIEDLEELDKNKFHDIAVVIYRGKIKEGISNNIYEALETSVNKAEGKAWVMANDKLYKYNQNYSSSTSDFNVPKLEPRLFSFNTPIGACPGCNGLGNNQAVTKELVLNPDKALLDGGIIPYKNNEEENITSQELEITCKYYGISLVEPVKNIKPELLDIILYGSKDVIHFDITTSSKRRHESDKKYEGIITSLNRRYYESNSEFIRTWIEGFMEESICPECNGHRLNKGALCVKINGLNISELTNLSIKNIYKFINEVQLTDTQKKIIKLAFDEIKNRLQFLIDVGLDYLDLARSGATLSGGEAQRIRLATQIGSKLSGVLYVLDEPSIGLHQKDNDRLIATLKKMRDLGNTLVVVEHDHDTMLASDHLVDIGPGAGEAGGYVVSQGTPEEVMKDKNSLTGQYLSNKLKVDYPKKRRSLSKENILIKKASENNLKDITVKIPLNNLVCVTGVSGSGKSTLVNEVLLKSLMHKYYKNKERPGKAELVEDYGLIDKIVEISQDPIGRTPRSNPATYTGVFDDIRELFANTNEAKIRGYEKGRFSFNVKGGRCESCWGDGVKKISMQFLPDVYVKCEVCNGKRFHKETLEVKYKDKDISDVLDMTITEACDFFSNHPKIYNKLETLNAVGLGYIKLGQSAPTLSGGEAQRVKLASELYRKITNKSLFILDEPTTGLHVDDVNRLLKVLHRIVDEGATMVVIEHNLDVIKNADYIIDLGPDGGEFGGQVIATGTPEEVSQNKESYTGQYLKKVL